MGKEASAKALAWKGPATVKLGMFLAIALPQCLGVSVSVLPQRLGAESHHLQRWGISQNRFLGHFVQQQQHPGMTPS